MSKSRESDQSFFSRAAHILSPTDASPPILDAATRDASYQWLTELQFADDLAQVGLKPRHSVILSGPPGCGKTTLAHHLSARLGLPMIVVDMQNIVSQYGNMSGLQISSFFRIVTDLEDDHLLFFDEIDAVAQKRSSDDQAVSQENNKIVIAILQAIDRYRGLFMAATNRADQIDPAIWRRFGMQLDVNLPDDDSRFAILKRYLHPMELPDDALDLLNELTEGATPADLQKLMEGVKRDLVLARRFDRPTDVVSTFVRVVVGIKPSPEIGPLPPLWREPKESLSQLASLPWPPKFPNRKKD